MRKFLVEYSDIIDEDELREYYQNEYEDNWRVSYARFLDEALGKNGSLTEILTEDTPLGFIGRAVRLYKVHYSADPDDVCEEWLTEQKAREKVWYDEVILEMV